MKTNVQIHSIQANSVVDGPGRRTVVFFQGCTLACPFCQNRKLWDKQGGYQTNTEDLAFTLAELARHTGNVTISGGEPFQQPEALVSLLYLLRANGVKHIIVYTGYTWDELLGICRPARHLALRAVPMIDVLVDGRFVKALDDPMITYRGSRNQRAVDVRASIEVGKVVELDWSQPEVIVDDAGNLVLPDGLALEFADAGIIAPSRMCGQTTNV